MEQDELEDPEEDGEELLVLEALADLFVDSEAESCFTLSESLSSDSG